MRKLNAKIITLILVAAMLLPTVGCASENNTPNSDTQNSGESISDSGSSETEAEELADNLPDKDLTGFTYRITGTDMTFADEFYVDELDGNIVNDAIYNKIATVEERFGCDIVLSESPGGDGDIKNVIMSGDDSFDIIQGHDIGMGTLSLEGCLVNVLEQPYFDFEKPWWPKNTVESLTVNGKMYLMANNISYFSMGETRVIFFNKTIAQDHNLGSLYQYVYDGTWTLDKMAELMKGVSKDADGNSIMDNKDIYGFLNPGYYYCWIEPFDIEPYKKDENGLLYYDFDVEKGSKLLEKFYNLLYGGEGFNETDWPLAQEMFSQGQALFMYETLKTAVNVFSTSDLVYGVLPMPKLDETQEEYRGGFTDRPFAIPVTAINNIDNVCLITEALNIEGYRQVFPAYYELALKSRYADETDDAAMIDIIHDSAVMSFGYLYGTNYDFVGALLGGSNPSTDVASYVAKQEKLQQKHVEKLNKFFSQEAEG